MRNRKLWVCVLVLVIVFGLISCGNETNTLDNTEPTTNNAEVTTDDTQTECTETTNPPETVPVVVNEYAVVDKFIDLYNTASTLPITDLVQMDIHGEDYITEFRLSSFKNAVGEKGTVNGGTVNVVNYGSWSNDKIRVYAVMDNADSAFELCTVLIHVMDSTISDDDIADQYERFSHTGSTNIYLGTAGYISGYINTSYANGGIDGYEIMIDCSKINFME